VVVDVVVAVVEEEEVVALIAPWASVDVDDVVASCVGALPLSLRAAC